MKKLNILESAVLGVSCLLSIITGSLKPPKGPSQPLQPTEPQACEIEPTTTPQTPWYTKGLVVKPISTNQFHTLTNVDYPNVFLLEQNEQHGIVISVKTEQDNVTITIEKTAKNELKPVKPMEHIDPLIESANKLLDATCKTITMYKILKRKKDDDTSNNDEQDDEFLSALKEGGVDISFKTKNQNELRISVRRRKENSLA